VVELQLLSRDRSNYGKYAECTQRPVRESRNAAVGAQSKAKQRTGRLPACLQTHNPTKATIKLLSVKI
jgi:hypothetical protein